MTGEVAHSCLFQLVDTVVTGRSFDLGEARRCLGAHLGAQPVDEMLLALSRVLDDRGGAPGGTVADRVGFDGRLRAVLMLLDEMPNRAALPNVELAGSVVVASLPGDRDTGAWLWRVVLAGHGYVVHSLGVKAPPVIAAHAVQLAPDALAIHVAATRSRAAVQAVVVNLARKGLRVPLIIGGAGVDPEFAKWIAIPEGGRPYWGGVYFCEDAREVLQVLRQIILFEPPPVAHSHDDATTPQVGCGGCAGCAFATSCDTL